MQQIIVIHGGTTFADYDQYLEFLQTKKLTIERLLYVPGWRELLQENLGDKYQVLLPKMPNPTNAVYEEWKLWFTHLAEIFTDECILIGHSLGAIFLAKYLSEEIFPKRIKATILVAAPFNDDSDEDLTDFKIEQLTELFKQQTGKLIFFNGTDDPVVKLEESERYKSFASGAEYHVMAAPDHFVRTDFPELVARIKELQ